MAFTEVKYILEAGRGVIDPSAVSMTLPLVSSYMVQRTPAKSFQWTIGKRPVREHSGIRDQIITLTGRSGLSYRLGQKASGAPYYADGPDLFREVEKFLYDFETNAAEAEVAFNLGRDNDPTMILRAVWEKHDFYVEPVYFLIRRSVRSSTCSYEYTLTLRAYGVASPAPLTFLGRIRDIADSAAKFVDQATAYVGMANQYIQEVDATARSFQEPVKAVGRLMREVSATSRSVRSVFEIPSAYVQTVFDTTEAATVAGLDAWYTLGFEDRAGARESLYDAMVAIGESRRVALDWLGQNFVRTGIKQDPVFNFQPSVPRIAPEGTGFVKAYPFKTGDTLFSIANILLGNPDLAALIAAMNGLPDMHTAPDGGPLPSGFILLIPVPESDGVAPVLPDGVGPDSLYGTDLLLDKDGDLLAVGTDPQDVATVRGARLLEQALSVRLKTVRGQHGVFPRYGLLLLVGERSSLQTTGTVASHVRMQVLADPRMAAVLNLTVVDGGDTYRVDCSAAAKGGPGVNLSVPIPVG